MAGFEFPPPEKVSGDGWEDVDYPVAGRGGGFILPPPQRTSGADTDEIAQKITGEISWIRETARDAWEGVGEVEDRVDNQGRVLTDYGDQLEAYGRDRVMPWAVPTVAPLSQTVNRWADSSFQLGSFLVGGTASEVPFLAGSWNTTTSRNFVFITPAVTRAYARINFLFSDNQGDAPAVFEFTVYVMDENGVMRRQHPPRRFTDEISADAQMVSLRFDTPWIAEQGTYIAVGFRKVSGGSRFLRGLRSIEYDLPEGVLPRGLTARMSGGGELPATINARTQLNFEATASEGRFVPYVELSEDVGVALRHLTDPLTGSGLLGDPWVALTGEAPRLYSRGASTSTGVVVGPGPRVAMYNGPLSTDRVRVEVVATPRNHSTAPAYFVVRGTNDLLNAVGVFVTNTAITIRSWDTDNIHNVAWGPGHDTFRGTHSHTLRAGDRIAAEHVDGLLTVYLNGAQILQWTVVGVPSGGRGRFLGIGFVKAELAFGGNPPHFRSWSARDLPQSNGDDGDEDGEGASGEQASEPPPPQPPQ